MAITVASRKGIHRIRRRQVEEIEGKDTKSVSEKVN